MEVTENDLDDDEDPCEQAPEGIKNSRMSGVIRIRRGRQRQRRANNEGGERWSQRRRRRETASARDGEETTKTRKSIHIASCFSKGVAITLDVVQFIIRE